MKYTIIFLFALVHFPVLGQPGIPVDRKPEIEKRMGNVYSVTEFLRVADSLQMSLGELSDYPLIFPIKKSVISSGFGIRRHPVFKVRKAHTGIDIAKANGTPVYATGNGTVVRKGYCTGYGNYIEIRHSGGFRSFYAHLSRATVNRGDSVCIAQQIARVGNTGLSTGCHLHYEVKKGNYFLNPVGWCRCLFELLIERDIQNY